MITKFIVGLMMFFGVTFGQVDNNYNGKGDKPNTEEPAKTIGLDDLGMG